MQFPRVSSRLAVIGTSTIVAAMLAFFLALVPGVTQGAHSTSTPSFVEGFEAGLGPWSSGIFDIDHLPSPGTDEVLFFGLPGSTTSTVTGTTAEVGLDTSLFTEGGTSLRTTVDALGGRQDDPGVCT